MRHAAENPRATAASSVNLSELRIGYVPVNDDWSAPADRRRFIGYARSRGLRVENASLSESYDVCVLSQRADLTVWRDYERAPIVYECIDSYILPPHDLRGRVRGIGKFVTRQHRKLDWRYDRSVQMMCARADAVVCSTDILRQAASSYCDNVHLILDIFDDALRIVKQSYAARAPLALLWEGLAAGAVRKIWPHLRDVVGPLLESGEARLHLVTDITYGSISDRFGRHHAADDVRHIFGPLAKHVSLYQWTDQTFAAIASACDLALIPIPSGDPQLWGKPENKLVLLWRTGMPVVASPTPAYREAMERSGLPLLCETLPEWHSTLRALAREESLRRDAAISGRRFAETNYDRDVMLSRWDAVLRSVVR